MQLSPQCRWQELKDIMRKIPPDGHIRQAHTDNKDGTGWGHITILNKKKAFDAYGTLKQFSSTVGVTDMRRKITFMNTAGEGIASG